MKLRACTIALVASLACTACDPGQVSIEFVWPEGRPMFAADQPVTTFLRVEERREAQLPGRVLVTADPQPFSTPRIAIPPIPYGNDRVIVVEARESREPDSQVLFYGLSEKFSLERGAHVNVPIFMQPTRPPRTLEEQQGSGGSLRVLTSSAAPGFVAGPDVELVLFSDTAVAARISNVIGLPEDQSVAIELGELPEVGAENGYRGHRARWNLDRDLRTPCAAGHTCARQIFARFYDARGYASRPVSTEVVIDAAPPAVVRGASAIAPPTANADSVVVVSLTASEVLRVSPLVKIAGFDGFELTRVYPEGPEPSSNYTFVAKQPASAIGADGEFTVIATLEDRVGNISRDQIVGTFLVDTPAPGLGALEIDPPRAGAHPGREVSVSFSLDERLLGGRYTVTLGGRAMDRCEESGEPPDLRVRCVRAMRGDEITMGTESVEAILVEAFDAADNVARLSGAIIFDFRPPRLQAAVFTPAIAREGITASLALSADEPLADGSAPQLRWSAAQAPAWTFFGTAGLDYTFQRTVDATVAEGAYVLTEIVLIDRADNVSAIVLQPPLIFTVDKTPPAIFDLQAEPARVGLAGAVTARFRLAEDPANGTMAVTFGGRPMDQCSISNLDVTCTRAMTGTEIPLGAEAGQALVADVSDAAGNAARASATVTADFRAPSLVDASFSSAVAREGAVVFLTMTSDEPLAAGAVPALEWAGGADPGITFLSTVGLSHNFSAIIGPATAEGTYTLDAVELADDAGNIARVALSPAISFEVDKRAPSLTGFSVSPARIGKSGTVTARFVLGEVVAASAISATLGGRAMACVQSGAAPAVDVTCTRAIAGNEIPDGVEAAQPVVADVADAAGNAVRASAQVVLDFRAPGVTAVSFAPAIAREGTAATLAITTDEALAAGTAPLLEWTGTDPGFVFQQTVGLTHFFGLTVGPSVAEGTYTLAAVTVRDDAGNSARVVIAPAARFQIDKTPPVIAGFAVTPARIGRSGTVTATFSLAEDLSTGVLAVSAGGRPMSCTLVGAAPSIAVTCTRAMTGTEIAAETELSQAIVADAVDAAGNSARATASVVFDFRAPNIVAGSASLQLVPAATNLLARLPGIAGGVDRLGVGTTAHLSFTLDEAASVTPSLATTPSSLAFAFAQQAGTSYVFTHTLAAGSRSQGAYTIQVTATDAVGNSAARALVLPAPGLVIDTVAPAAPATLLITHERFPWGSDAVGAGPRAAVTGASGAVEANARVVILGSAELAAFDVLGSALSNASGGFARFWLDHTADRPEVYVTVLDGAGNAAASTSGVADRASRVRAGTWTATLRGKVPGSRTPNPHEVRQLAWIEATLAQDTGGATEPTAAEMAALDATDGALLRATTLRRWEEVTASASQPSAREGAAIAYDTMRGRVVLFGGLNGTTRNRETWEWDGRRWYSVAPAGPRPPERSHAAMAFDAARGRVVLFGGTGVSGVLADTWTWDGTDWVEVTPAGSGASPSARARHAMAYDAARGEVVVYGGENGSGTALGGTFTWNGASWTSRCGGFVTCPSARRNASMAYDFGAQRIVLFGGSQGAGSTLLGEQWEWSGASWSRVPVGSGVVPSAREGAMLAYDFARGAAVLFGGRDASGLRRDVWSAWTEVTPASGELQPPVRSFAAMAFDVRRQEIVVFGGRGASGALGDTWAWNGVRWRELTTAAGVPAMRSEHGMAYDAASRRMIMFGGQDGTTRFGDTWSWSGTGWFALSPVTPPTPRKRLAMASYDQNVFFFGGSDGSNLLDETWAWNGARWTPMATGGFARPVAREDHAMAFDSARRRAVLFGGSAAGSALHNDTWEWDGGSWLIRSAGGSGAPPVRSDHALAYDSARAQTTLFGGVGAGGTTLGDLWEWNGTSWTMRSFTGGPSPRLAHSMAADAGRGRIVVFGGRDVSTSFSDLWEWDGAGWSQLTTTRLTPGARSGAALAYDPDRGVLVLSCGTSAASDVWELHADPAQRPGLIASIDWAAAGLDGAILGAIEATAGMGGRGYTVQLPGIGSARDGSELAVWNAQLGAWTWQGTTAAGMATPGVATFNVTSEIGDLITHEEQLHLLVRAQTGTGNGPGAAEVGLDNVEVKVTYSYPD